MKKLAMTLILLVGTSAFAQDAQPSLKPDEIAKVLAGLYDRLERLDRRTDTLLAGLVEHKYLLDAIEKVAPKEMTTAIVKAKEEFRRVTAEEARLRQENAGLKAQIDALRKEAQAKPKEVTDAPGK